MLESNFAPGARLVTQLKDLTIALDMAGVTGANLPITERVAGMYRELVERGFGEEDHSALWRLVAEQWN
jgi:3-hydroxyisobutyrate dehydrogenase